MSFIALNEAYVAFGLSKNILMCTISSNKCEIIGDAGGNEQSVKPAKEDKNIINQTNSSLDYFSYGEFSPCGNYFAALTDAKFLYVWEMQDGQWVNPKRRTLVKRCVRLRFTPCSGFILVADRAGDVYQFSTKDPSDAPAQLLLGHVSMLLDLAITQDKKYVITCDRDEKIRVSFYPNTYNIQAFCLGHRQFVSGIALLTDCKEMLLSGSGDGTLALWLYEEGKLLYKKDVSEDMPKRSDCGDTSEKSVEECPVVKHLIMSKFGIAAVSFYKKSVVALYKVSSLKDAPSVEFLHLLETSSEPTHIQFDSDGFLWVLALRENQMLTIFEPNLEGNSYIPLNSTSEKTLLEVCESINGKWDLFKDCPAGNNSVDILFKQHYDNVETYYEKKKEREKCKKQKLS